MRPHVECWGWGVAIEINCHGDSCLGKPRKRRCPAKCYLTGAMKTFAGLRSQANASSAAAAHSRVLSLARSSHQFACQYPDMKAAPVSRQDLFNIRWFFFNYRTLGREQWGMRPFSVCCVKAAWGKAIAQGWGIIWNAEDYWFNPSYLCLKSQVVWINYLKFYGQFKLTKLTRWIPHPNLIQLNAFTSSIPGITSQRFSSGK